jgi:hypothetical protein
MRHTYWILPFALVALALLVKTPDPTPQLPRPPGVQPVDDTPDPKENPQGRRHWEWQRLHDPATGRIPPDIHRKEVEFAARLPRRQPGVAIGGLNSGVDKFAGWSYRGPWNIGGRTRALAVDVADPSFQTLLAGGVSGGMWRSTDDGASWTLTTGSSQLHSVSCIVQDTRPGHENVWYYGTGEGMGSSTSRGGDDYRGDGVFKSTDGGVTWSLLPSTSTGLPQEFDKPFDFVWRLVMDTTNLVEDEVYAATWGVIYRSTDGGTTWIPVLGDPDDPSRYTDLIITSTGILYATLSSEGGQPGIFRSLDGLVWARIDQDLMANFGRIALAVAPSNENLVFFLVSHPNTSLNIQFWRYTYNSGDGSGSGGFWSDRTYTLQALPYPYGDYGYIYSLWPQRGYNLLVDVDPTNHNQVFAGAVHLWRSNNGFSNQYGSDRVGGYYYDGRSHHADQHLLVRRPGSVTVAYTASDGGVHKTTNLTAADVTWTSLNNGYNTSQFFTVALDPDLPGNNVVLGGTQDNGTLWTRSESETADWAEIFGGDGAFCAVLDAAAGDYLVSYYFANIFRILIDEAGNEVQAARVNHDLGGDYLFINPFISDPQQEVVVFLASSNGVWRNDDITAIPWGNADPVSTNWVHLTSEPAGDFISALGANAQPDHSLYYGTATGGLYKVPDALRAAAGSTPIALHGQAAFPADAYLSDIAVHPDDDDKVLLSFGNYGIPNLWYTDDGGTTWTDVESNLGGTDSPSVRAVAIVPGDGVDLWLTGTSTGIYSTLWRGSGSVIWVQEAPETIGHVVVDDLMVRQSDRKVVVGTHGRGIFSVIVPEATDVPQAQATSLAQNVPNPFNPDTEIWFNLSAPGPVRLTVHDLSGRLVCVLFEGHQDAGEHTASWNGTDAGGRPVGSGVYLYRFEAQGMVEQRKMTLVK